MKFDFKKVGLFFTGLIGRRFMWLAILIITGLAGLSWFLVFRQQYYSLQSSGVLEYKSRLTQKDRLSEQLGQLEKMQAEYKKLNREKLYQLEAVLPRGFNKISFMAELERFAVEVGATIERMDVTENKETSAMQSATASIVLNFATNTYENFKLFLGRLEKNTPLFDLRNLTYSGDLTSITMEFTTFYYRP